MISKDIHSNRIRLQREKYFEVATLSFHCAGIRSVYIGAPEIKEILRRARDPAGYLAEEAGKMGLLVVFPKNPTNCRAVVPAASGAGVVWVSLRRLKCGW